MLKCQFCCLLRGWILDVLCFCCHGERRWTVCAKQFWFNCLFEHLKVLRKHKWQFLQLLIPPQGGSSHERTWVEDLLMRRPFLGLCEWELHRPSSRKVTLSTSSRSPLWGPGLGSWTTKWAPLSSSMSTSCRMRAPQPGGHNATAGATKTNQSPEPWRRCWTAWTWVWVF